MSEELIQRNLVEAPEKMGDWNFYNIGATTLKALKNAKIIPNRDYAEFEGKKPDALIVKKPLVIAAIEYKTPQELRTKTQIAKAIAQELGTAHALQARVYIVTDGKNRFGSIRLLEMKFYRRMVARLHSILTKIVQNVFL